MDPTARKREIITPPDSTHSKRSKNTKGYRKRGEEVKGERGGEGEREREREREEESCREGREGEKGREGREGEMQIEEREKQ